jgi:hypothetical protein
MFHLKTRIKNHLRFLAVFATVICTLGHYMAAFIESEFCRSIFLLVTWIRAIPR